MPNPDPRWLGTTLEQRNWGCLGWLVGMAVAVLALRWLGCP